MVMEHGADKIGPARDEMMKKALRAEMTTDRSLRAAEERELQPAGEDQPEVAQAPDRVFRGGTPQGMTEEDVGIRSELARHLGRSIYPADKPSVIDKLRRDNAPDRLVSLAEKLPPEGTYPNMQSIAQSLGLGTERRRG
ncbi:DUF2795 domain-containing protein [Streptomyces sp. NBC_01525]|uniref:DUF2795 domain-containing protein n=2 Tax=Streptomyces benahoarensis TaxID=2595054 RepID=A0A553ZK67_9ACTN|nr:DUF2795 domain-containing protein [Streptomyces benahoarensis]TSB24534.1 DUF2795 domain-containing protein [Streptomyces benahoarensis]TSB41854.1 DUF2795 domain-containing protein [Streptomyces benahoarensis]